MSYLTRKIKTLNFFIDIIFALLITVAYVFGHYFYVKGVFSGRYFFVIAVLGTCSVLVSHAVFHFRNKAANYIKGKDGEDYIEGILINIPNITYQRSVKLKKRDLDFVVFTKHGIYGLEVKNISGKISSDKGDGRLIVNNHYCKMLDVVKSASAEARDKLAKKNLDIKFIQPVLVFCNHRACINVPNNKITSNGVDVYVIGSSQLREFFK